MTRVALTLQQCIDEVDEIKPNDFSDETKTRWLNEIEGKIQTEVMLIAGVDVIQYSYPENKDWELLVEPPYDGLYPAYLAARIDYANGEYEKYQNTMQMFNEFYNDFVRWYASNYAPADAYREGLM